MLRLIDAAGSHQVRWFMRMLDKWNVEKKNRFDPSNEPVEDGFSLLIYYSSNVPTSILSYCTYRLISLACSSGYAPYLRLSLIYFFLTHLECFRFFLAANIVAAPRQRAQYKQRLWRLCPPYCKREVGFLDHAKLPTRDWKTHQVLSSWLNDLLVTGLRHARASQRLTIWNVAFIQHYTVIGTLAVDRWAVTFGTARRGMGGLASVPTSYYSMCHYNYLCPLKS